MMHLHLPSSWRETPDGELSRGLLTTSAHSNSPLRRGLRHLTRIDNSSRHNQLNVKAIASISTPIPIDLSHHYLISPCERIVWGRRFLAFKVSIQPSGTRARRRKASEIIGLLARMRNDPESKTLPIVRRPCNIKYDQRRLDRDFSRPRPSRSPTPPH